MPDASSPLRTSSDPPRRKGERTAGRILDAAEKLFADLGYSGTTMRDVARAVRLRPPSLYNHFPSKDALYAAVLERGISPVLETLAKAIADNERDPGSAPRRLVEKLMAQLAQRPELPRLIQHETLSGGGHLSPMLRQWITPVFASADRMAQLGPQAGRWKPDELPLLVIAMYNVIVGYFTIAPLYRELNGRDLLGEEAIAAQTRMFSELVNALFVTPPVEVTPEPSGSRT